MELRFLSPDLRKLDQSGSELLVAQVAQGELPPRGALGLIDYRLGGRISTILAEGRVTGLPGERFLLPGRPKLPFDKILLLGVGAREDFSLARYDELVELLLVQIADLGVRRAVVELPGRPDDWLGIADALELLRERATAFETLDVWTLLEPPDSAKIGVEVLKRERSRQWGL